eukprot:1136893-Pelagomonas_calceolata.AAC.3
MVHACPNSCLAVLDLAAAVCVSPGLPICNFELEAMSGPGTWAWEDRVNDKESGISAQGYQTSLTLSARRQAKLCHPFQKKGGYGFNHRRMLRTKGSHVGL